MSLPDFDSGDWKNGGAINLHTGQSGSRIRWVAEDR